MKVAEGEARNLLKMMGFHTWDRELRTVEKKLNNLPKYMESSTEIDGDEKVLALRICAVVNDGEKVEVQKEGVREEMGSNSSSAVDEVVESNGTVEEAPAKKPRKKKESSEPKEKKEPVGKDKFGSKLGSSKAKLNACFSKKAKTLPQLVEEAGLPNAYYRKHLKKLIEDGMIEHTEDGYKLASKPSVSE